MRIPGIHSGSNYSSVIASLYITDAALIATITDVANWNGDGNYTGPTVDLKAGNKYFDTVNGVEYEFDGTNLFRNIVNNVI